MRFIKDNKGYVHNLEANPITKIYYDYFLYVWLKDGTEIIISNDIFQCDLSDDNHGDIDKCNIDNIISAINDIIIFESDLEFGSRSGVYEDFKFGDRRCLIDLMELKESTAESLTTEQLRHLYNTYFSEKETK